MVHSYSNRLDFLHSDLFVIVYLVFFRICVCVSVFVFVFVFVFLSFFVFVEVDEAFLSPRPPSDLKIRFWSISECGNRTLEN